MGAVSVSSCITGRCGGAPTSCRSQMQLQERRHRCRDFVACRQRLQGGLCAVSRFSKRRVCVVGSRSGGFGPRVFSSGEGRLGFTGVRNGAVRAQEDEKENQELDKVEDKGSGKGYIMSSSLVFYVAERRGGNLKDGVQ
jgi:hypothetical protein